MVFHLIFLTCNFRVHLVTKFWSLCRSLSTARQTKIANLKSTRRFTGYALRSTQATAIKRKMVQIECNNLENLPSRSDLVYCISFVLDSFAN